MKTEKVVLSFISVLFGLIVAGIVFYVYQSTKVIPSQKIKSLTVSQPTPTNSPSIFLSLSNPSDESVVSSKSITVAGKTIPTATVVVITPTDQQVIQPASNGDFSVSTTIDSDENVIYVTSIAPNGEEAKVTKTITYSTEAF